MSESQLRAEVSERDPRWDERRRGDSDVDWGDESDGPGQDQETRTGQVTEDLGAMDVDPELELGLEAMKTFVNGMNRGERPFVTMDDIADQEKMRQEDEEKEDNRGSSGDEDEVVELVKNQHEIAMIGGEEEIGVESAEEDNQDSSGDEDEEVDFAVNQQEIAVTGEAQEGGLENSEKMEDDDEDFISSDGDDSPGSPRASFQTRLERLRRKAEGKRRASPQFTSGDVDSSEEEDTFVTHAEETADLLAEIQVSFLWNSDISSSCDRSGIAGRGVRSCQRPRQEGKKEIIPSHSEWRLPWSERDGSSSRLAYLFHPPVALSGHSGRKGQWPPPELHQQWEKDRLKKAENKRLRRQALLEQAADPFSVKKGGKKSRKLMRAAAQSDPNRIVNMSTLVEQIRRFAENIEGPSMALPPMEKFQRKQVHEVALAFNLKSHSKGKGLDRYTTLWRTTYTGLQIDERKIARYLRNQDMDFVPAGKAARKNPRPKEGDEVGKVCIIILVGSSN